MQEIAEEKRESFGAVDVYVVPKRLEEGIRVRRGLSLEQGAKGRFVARAPDGSVTEFCRGVYLHLEDARQELESRALTRAEKLEAKARRLREFAGDIPIREEAGE